MSAPLDCQTVFKKYDKSSKGYLTRHELKCALAFLLGKVVDYKTIKWCQGIAGREAKGFGYESFAQIVEALHKEELDPEERMIKSMFKSFKNSANSKFISLEDYLDAVGEMNERSGSVNYKEALSAFFEIDSNKDCLVTYKDFYDLMKFSP